MGVEIERLSTGVEGFDPLIAGGIPRGFFVAIVGEPGTGKTVFCIHYAWRGVLEGDKVIYVTTEESRESIMRQALMFGMDFPRAVDEGRMIIIDALTRGRGDEWSLNELDVEELIGKVIDAKKALGYGRARLVVDSMSAFWLDKPAMARKYSYNVKRILYKWDMTSLLVSQYAITTQSLPHWEPIVVRRGDDLRVTTIGEFVNSFLGGEGSLDISRLGYYTLSLNPETLKLEWRRIRGVIKHKLKGGLIQVKTSQGKTITLTGSHSVYRFTRRLALEVVGAQDLRLGDFLVTPARLYLPEDAPEYINVARELWERGLRNLYVAGLPESVVGDPHFINSCKRKRRYMGSARDCIRSRAAPLKLLLSIYGEDAWNLILNSRVNIIEGGSASTPIPVKIPVNEAFYLLLGFIISSGYVGKSKITVTFGIDEESYARDVINAVKSIAPEVRVSLLRMEKRNRLVVTIYSRILAEVFRRVLGIKPGVSNKEIPSLVFRAPAHMKKEFLRGLYAGDGNFNGHNGSLIYTTSSLKLVNGLALLLLSLGIRGFSVQTRNNGGAFDLVVVRPEELEILRGVVEYLESEPPKRGYAVKAVKALPRGGVISLLASVNPGKARSGLYNHLGETMYASTTGIAGRIPQAPLTLKRLTAASDNRLSGTVNMLNKYVKGDIGLVELNGLEPINEEVEYVYDISVEGNESFFAGTGWILVHNSAFGWGIEHVADGIIRFRRALKSGALNRYVLIEKMRQTPHDLRLHKIDIIDGKGMIVKGPVELRREDVTLPEEVKRKMRKSRL